jgi:hypothetical protein
MISLMGSYVMLYLYPDHDRFMQHIQNDWPSLKSKGQVITYVNKLLLQTHTKREGAVKPQLPLPTFSFFMAILDIVSELNCQLVQPYNIVGTILIVVYHLYNLLSS